MNMPVMSVASSGCSMPADVHPADGHPPLRGNSCLLDLLHLRQHGTSGTAIRRSVDGPAALAAAADACNTEAMVTGKEFPQGINGTATGAASTAARDAFRPARGTGTVAAGSVANELSDMASASSRNLEPK